MAVGSPAKIAKVLLIIINILFILTGLALIVVGSCMIALPNVSKVVSAALPDQSGLFKDAGILLIAMGAFVVVVAVIGMAAAIVELTPLLAVYITLLTLVFCGEMAGGIIAIVYQDRIQSTIGSKLMASIQNNVYYTDSQSGGCQANGDAARNWDYIQYTFGCCGVYDDNSGYESTNISLICKNFNIPADNKPLTCCYDKTEFDFSSFGTADQRQYQNNFDCTQVSNQGCADELILYIQKYAPVLIGIGIGIAMFQLLVILFAVCLCQHTEKGKQSGCACCEHH